MDPDRRRNQKRVWQNNKQQATTDIGAIPQIRDKKRRDRCSKSLLEFCLTYRKEAFYLGFSDDHLQIIQQMEDTILNGGLFALAMPRGSGKTTLSITAAMWALLYGYRKWLVLIGATAPKAEQLLKSIGTELRFNDLLMEDFPEVCFPIRCLDGQPKRAVSQNIQGKKTNMVWHKSRLTLPTVEGSVSSNATISVCGITGDIRGQQDTGSDGSVKRPDFVILDDPQTNESARSHTQTADRLRIVYSDILGLSGPKTKISGFCPCTVIQKNDFADQLLDREKSADWNGVITKLIYGMPKNMDLWEQYAEIRKNSLMNGGRGKEATEFYVEHRERMDEGVEPAWECRFNNDEVSAIQNAMNLYFLNQEAFFSEYQNDPLEQEEANLISHEDICLKTHAEERGVVPPDTDFITAFVDVQKELLFYAVVAWRRDFTGYVLQYGAYPEQGSTNFTYITAHKRINKVFNTLPLEVQLTRSLENVIDQICGHTYKMEDGAELSVSRMMIDAAWGDSTTIVFNTIKGSNHRALVNPSFGRGIGARSQPLNFKYISSKGSDRSVTLGKEWRIAKGKHPVRHVVYDANYWKSFLHARLNTPLSSKGSLSFYKAPPHHHRMIADNILSEYPIRTQGQGRELDEWRLKPGHDNHFFDCLVGNCVAASIMGAEILDVTKSKKLINNQQPDAPQKKKRKVKKLF